MSSLKTEQYQLHQWEPGDSVLREEFNENFAKLDVSTRLFFGSYTGDGAAERLISLPITPKAVLLFTQKGCAGYVGSYEKAFGGLFAPDFPLCGSSDIASVKDGGIVVRHRSDHFSGNMLNKVYYYLAFC